MNTPQTFGKDGHLLALGPTEGRSGAARLFKFLCKKCSEDSELFGDGIFLSTKAQILNGVIPCGCSKSPRLSAQQYEVKIKRWCDVAGLEFGGFDEDFVGVCTKLILRCPAHNYTWRSTPIATALTRGVSCKFCKAKPHEDEVLQNSNYPEGTKVKKHASGKYELFCPVCAADEYSQAGVGNGSFLTVLSTLKAGQKPCRCSNHAKLNDVQQEYRIRKILDSTIWTFHSWLDGYKNNRSKFRLECPIHGIVQTSVVGFDKNVVKCTM